VGAYQLREVIGKLELSFLDLVEIGWTLTILAEGREFTHHIISCSKKLCVGFITWTFYTRKGANSPIDTKVIGSVWFNVDLIFLPNLKL
jgi:hypothetical protein